MSGLSDENIREMIQALDLIKGGFRWRSHFHGGLRSPSTSDVNSACSGRSRNPPGPLGGHPCPPITDRNCCGFFRTVSADHLAITHNLIAVADWFVSQAGGDAGLFHKPFRSVCTL